MKIPFWRAGRRGASAAVVVTLFLLTGAGAFAQSRATNVLVLEVEGGVEFMPSGAQRWLEARTNLSLVAGDKLRTGSGRATVQLSDRSIKRYGPYSQLEIPAESRGAFSFLRGLMYYFHRDKAGTYPVQTPTTFAVVRGTEFQLRVETNGTTMLSMFDGAVEMQTPQGNLTLQSGEEGIAEPGQPPRKKRITLLEANNIIQWVLYYPGVLDVDELPLNADEQAELAESLRRYRAGDLLGAKVAYPEARNAAASAGESIYHAALLLSVGEVQTARELLTAATVGAANDSRGVRLANSLQRVIDAVRNPSALAGQRLALPNDSNPLATELLSEAYVEQAQLNLVGALANARRATDISPRFGFAWEAVAELEFSFRRVPLARVALERSLELAPRNAQAYALRGFLLAADNNIDAAFRAFDEAIAMDGALPNAWLGRGLCRIRRGEAEAGRQDLEVAATLDPQRAILRSYLSKAWSNEGDVAHATNEIRRAKQLDPNDPTSWLYSALLNAQQNRINEGVRDLEHSQALNDNRQIFRSRLLLDDDLAVRSANLAAIYRDAGMIDVSVREAARATSFDYSSYSAHLFLADSYNALRDPRQVDLRYETAFLSEYLLANLLSPAAVGTLTPQVSQQEYTRLFESEGLGMASSTEYFSRGDWIESAVQYGNFKDFSYSVGVAYRSENGDRPNDDFEQTSVTVTLKQQLTPRDGLYLQTSFYDAEGGDVGPRYYPDAAILGLRTKEQQEALVLAGYHHEWSPGQHTLLLLGYVPDHVTVRNPQQNTLVLDRFAGPISDVIPVTLGQHYESKLELYTAEIQQIVSHPHGTFIAGGRLQGGPIHTESIQGETNVLGFVSAQDVSSELARASVYGYELWQVFSKLQLTAGVSYDWVQYPSNFRYAPVVDNETSTGQFSPKAGFIYEPLPNTFVRGAYTRGLGGVSFDQSFRLEPSQVAGFNQAFRSIIPEAVAGANAGATFQTAGLSLEQKFATGTYLGLLGEVLWSDVDRDVGVFEYDGLTYATQTRESLNYREQSLLATFNQLIGEGLSIGAAYRLSLAELEDEFPGIPTGGGFSSSQKLEALLQSVRLFVIYNHPSGFFTQFDAVWFDQTNDGYNPSLAGDSFWQFDIFAGYRFARRRVQVTVGVLNLTDQDYRLNPLNLTATLPLERTFYSSLQFNF